MYVVKPAGEDYQKFLSRFSQDGSSIEDGLYIIDPFGNYMMRYAPDAEPKKVLRDLERLLKVSKFG